MQEQDIQAQLDTLRQFAEVVGSAGQDPQLKDLLTHHAPCYAGAYTLGDKANQRIQRLEKTLTIIQAGYKKVALPEQKGVVRYGAVGPNPRVIKRPVMGMFIFMGVIAILVAAALSFLSNLNVDIVVGIAAIIGLASAFIGIPIWSLNDKELCKRGLPDTVRFLSVNLPRHMQDAYDRAMNSGLFSSVLVAAPKEAFRKNPPPVEIIIYGEEKKDLYGTFFLVSRGRLER